MTNKYLSYIIDDVDEKDKDSLQESLTESQGVLEKGVTDETWFRCM